MSKQLETNQIFDILNIIKTQIGLATSDFLDNQVVRDKAISKMEVRFNNIIETLDTYFECKKVLNQTPR